MDDKWQYVPFDSLSEHTFFPDFCHSRVYAVELASRRFVRMEDWFCANLCVDRNWGYFLLSTGQISRQRFSRQGFDISVHLRLRIFVFKYLISVLLERHDSPVSWQTRRHESGLIKTIPTLPNYFHLNRTPLHWHIKNLFLFLFVKKVLLWS